MTIEEWNRIFATGSYHEQLAARFVYRDYRTLRSRDIPLRFAWQAEALREELARRIEECRQRAMALWFWGVP